VKGGKSSNTAACVISYFFHRLLLN